MCKIIKIAEFFSLRGGSLSDTLKTPGLGCKFARGGISVAAVTVVCFDFDHRNFLCVVPCVRTVWVCPCVKTSDILYIILLITRLLAKTKKKIHMVCLFTIYLLPVFIVLIS